MHAEQHYLDVNREAWNNKVDIHHESAFYNMPAFMQGQSSLNDIELNLLGNVQGKSILHLQCHFGQDTISLARMGAQVTGVDFSNKAIDLARQLNQELRTSATFIECDIYNLPNALNETFDIVYTSYGTIGWLPNLDQWAQVITHFLKPGGRFVFVDFHPVVWMFDNNFTQIQYRYFNDAPIVETETGTYADKQSKARHTTITWNHGMAEMLSALLKQGLKLHDVAEFDYSPYPCFNASIEHEPGKFSIQHLNKKIPMVYAVTATNPAM